jgi:hypothetical protein
VFGITTSGVACCAAGRSGQPVVNADQTVIIVWDAATRTQHFIRQASFKSEGDDFGFIVPSPTQPTLGETGDEAFRFLRKLTEPETKRVSQTSGGLGCGCAGAKLDMKAGGVTSAVTVLDQKAIAGYDAAVLEATSSDALVDWLRENDYAYSPEVAAWAQPYVEQGWKFTALKVAKDKGESANKDVATKALRLSFQTERPLFPYREPDSTASAKSLGASSRLLRIYFLAGGRYEGQLTESSPWTGRVAWANELAAADRKKTLELLGLPDAAAPDRLWLTEFEDNWPYAVAPADVYFARDDDQGSRRRDPIIEYVYSPWTSDLVMYGLLGLAIAHRLWRRCTRVKACPPRTT